MCSPLFYTLASKYPFIVCLCRLALLKYSKHFQSVILVNIIPTPVSRSYGKLRSATDVGTIESINPVHYPRNGFLMSCGHRSYDRHRTTISQCLSGYPQGRTSGYTVIDNNNGTNLQIIPRPVTTKKRDPSMYFIQSCLGLLCYNRLIQLVRGDTLLVDPDLPVKSDGTKTGLGIPGQ